MKKLVAICFLSIPLLIFSQEYKSAWGIKMGYPGYVGFNGKIYLGQRFALDNLLGTNFDNDNRFLSLQSLFEYNQKFGKTRGYNWYAGIGPHALYYTTGAFIHNTGGETSGFMLKADGVIGAEYSATRTRFNAAVEAGPTVFVYPFVHVGAYANIALRFTIPNMRFH